MIDCKLLVADFNVLEKLYNTHRNLERLVRKIAEFYFLEKDKKKIKMALLDVHKRYLIMRNRFSNIEAIIPQYQIASFRHIANSIE